MADEAIDVVQPQAAPESSPETPAPAEAPASTEEPAADEASLSESTPAPRSEKRIRELVAERDHFKKLADLTSKNQPQTPSASVGADDEGAQLTQIIEGAVSKALGPMAAELNRAQADRQIEQVRQQFPDFDQFLPEITAVLESDETLRATDNAVRNAYLIARGVVASETAKEARDQGREEAYRTIDQKGRAAEAQPAPKLATNPTADLLARFRAGKLSADERKANWPQLVSAMQTEKE